MELIKLGGWYKDDMIENAKNICKVAQQINTVVDELKDTNKVSCKEGHDLMINIKTVLQNWTGNTYIGHNKERVLKDAFQQFFQSLYSLILHYRYVDNKLIKEFADHALYKGTLYRYLGQDSDSYHENKTRIAPIYNNIWVSWSKNKENLYIENKLYGTITRLTCNTDIILGIDLTAFGASLRGEDEVVYPTIEATIDEVEYLDRNVDETE